MDTKYYLETERLILRDMLPADDAGMFKLDSNADVHKYLGNNPIKTIEEARKIIENIRQQYEDNGIGRWAVIEKSSGHFIGWSGLKFIKEPVNGHIDFYDVGYRFIPEYWGKGYATESAKAAIEYGFTQMKLNEIIGTADINNAASRRALEKSGLRFIAKFDFTQWNKECDWLSISKEEWEKQSKKGY